MTQPKKKPAPFVLPPHANAEPHRKVMARLAKMSDKERFQTLVDAGIYNQKGQLMPPYADEKDSPKKKAAPAKNTRGAVAAKTARTSR